MRILYLATTVHLSTKMDDAIGASTHTLGLSNAFGELGHEVILVTEKRFSNDRDKDTINGHKVYRFPRYIPTAVKKSRSGIKKYFKFLKNFPLFITSFKLMRVINKEKIDCIFCRSHTLKIGTLLAIILKKPLYLEVIDPIYTQIDAQKAKTIFAYTKGIFPEEFHKKIYLVTAGVDPAIFHPVNRKKTYDCVYIGAFKEWDGLEDIILAVKYLKGLHLEIKVLLIGDGVRRYSIEQLVSSNNLTDNIYFTGKVSLGSISKFASQAKIGIAPYNTRLSERGKFDQYGFYFSPLKVVEYLRMGLPVVSSNYPLIKKIITSNIGITYPPGNIKLLAESLVTLANDKNLGKKGEDCLEKSEKYTWKKVAREMISVMNKG